MKKLISVLLLCGMFLQLAACTADPATVETADTEETQVVPEGETREQTKLPKLDFEGAVFNTGFKGGEQIAERHFSEELSSDNMKASLYRRAKTTENMLNVILKWDVDVGLEKVRELFLAGEDVHQQYILTGNDESHIIVGGYLYNTDTLPYIETSSSWWNQSQIDALRLGKNTYFLVSDFLLTDPAAIFFNWDMIEDNNFENPYTMVNEGTWTLDKLQDMCIAVKNDADGDGLYESEDDILGLTYGDTSQLAPFFPGCGQFITERTEDGKIAMAMNNERTLLIWDKLLRFNANAGSIPTSNAIKAGEFSNSRSLFAADKISALETYAGMSGINVGLVPFPKFDEAQEQYYSLGHDPIIAVPDTIKNPELVGAVLEFLAWESGNEVTNTYYEKLMKTRYSADLETRAMVELIFDTLSYEIGITYFMFQNGFCGLSFLAVTPITGDNQASARLRFERTRVKNVLQEFYTELDKIEGTAETEETAAE